MLISHLLLKNFGKFEKFNCDFTPGLNLIKGPNEAGKTTLAHAITAALFLDPTKGSKELVTAISWKTKELPALEAVFEVDGKSAKLVKDFKHGRTALEDGRTGIKIGEVEDVGKWLSEQLGISSEEIFKATACVSQGDISHIEDSFEAIKDKLESLITGGREDQAASQTTAKIEARITEISGNGGTGGVLDDIEKQTEEMNQNVERLNKAISNYKSRRADLIQVEQTYSNVKDDLKAKKDKLEKSKKAGKIEEVFAKASQEYHDIQAKLVDAQDSLKKIKSLRDRDTGLHSVAAKDIKEIDAIEANLNYMRPKHHELESDRNDAKNEYSAYKVGQAYLMCAIFGIFGIGLSLLSYFDMFLPQLKPWMGYALLASIILLFLGVAMTRTRTHHRNYLKERFNKLEAKLTELDSELSKHTGVLKAHLAKYKVDSVEDLKHSLWQRGDLEKQIAREKELYEGSLGGNSIQDLEARFAELEEIMEKVKRDKRELSQHVVDESDLARQMQVISQYEERLKDLERERTVLRQQLESAEGGAELLASFVERRDQLKSRSEKLKHEVAILKLTAECVNEARQNVLVSTLEVLNAKTSEILKKLTAGRYTRARFDKSTMKFEIYCNERDQWIDPERGLSWGTLDQVYLAARLALADIVSEHKYPPVILDDPFANYDEDRLENAMKLLKELSANHQILLLTSHGNYDRWADSTISL
jgi:DNA repair exonuclease SbcCD ATPase subunit